MRRYAEEKEGEQRQIRRLLSQVHTADATKLSSLVDGEN